MSPQWRKCWKPGCEDGIERDNGSCVKHEKELLASRRREARERLKGVQKRQCWKCRGWFTTSLHGFLKKHKCGSSYYHWSIHERAIQEGITPHEAEEKSQAEQEARRCPTCGGKGFLPPGKKEPKA